MFAGKSRVAKGLLLRPSKVKDAEAMQVEQTTDPMALFQEWFALARAKEINDGDAVALATADGDGQPNARMVLLKGADERGFVFYTNSESRKGTELSANPRAALCFHWKSLRRQIRVQGPVAPIDAAESDAYFASRPRDSQIGAWASQQSRPLESRFALEKAVARYAAKFAVGAIPRPTYWMGYRLRPQRIEFWEDRPFRLHDRHVFTRVGAGWQQQWLYP
jgi:pyridoxamine 5'-phosphate oxidase